MCVKEGGGWGEPRCYTEVFASSYSDTILFVVCVGKTQEYLFNVFLQKVESLFLPYANNRDLAGLSMCTV